MADARLHLQGTRRASTMRRDSDYNTFCSISLTSERDVRASRRSSLSLSHSHSHSQGSLQEPTHGVQVQYLAPPALPFQLQLHTKAISTSDSSSDASTWRAYCLRLGRLRCFAVFCLVLFLLGCVGVARALFFRSMQPDDYVCVGALVSIVFSLIVVLCFVHSRTVRTQPNPLLLSKSILDVILGLSYVAQYALTEYSRTTLVLPFRIAALTQALLVAGEFWLFAMPFDMVQSITNPFTSYARNLRQYWFYSTLTGLLCGAVFWFWDDGPDRMCLSGPNAPERCRNQENTQARVSRFFWFHDNTTQNPLWWHRWIAYHLWVVIYLVFAILCIQYVRTRLARGLDETFDVRRRILTSGLLACWIYVAYSLLVLVLFVLANAAAVRTLLPESTFISLLDLSGFLHAARGCLNITVWLVLNHGSLLTLLFRSHRTPTTWTFGVNPHGSTTEHSTSRSESDSGAVSEEEALLTKPELNTALRRQMIRMATTGIVESVEHYHRLHRRILSNQTFHLDWQRSPQRRLRQLSSSLSDSRAAAVSTVQIVDEFDGQPTSTQRFFFFPMAMQEMQFYDFQPRVFSSIRQLCGINDPEYVYAFRMTINERISEGRSGAFVFNSCDRMYLVKSTTAREKDVLLEILPSYLRYLKWNPKTLLPRFFGFHAMKMYGQIFYFVVMSNIFNTDDIIHRRYDIKGSWVDRNAPACVLGDKYRCANCHHFFKFGGDNLHCEASGSGHAPDITLRDNDLKKRLKLDVDTSRDLQKQLVRDSNFLASMNIMDYSLLIGAHYSHFTISSANTPPIKSPVSKTITNASTPNMDLSESKALTDRLTGDSDGTAYLHVLCHDPAASTVAGLAVEVTDEEENQEVKEPSRSRSRQDGVSLVSSSCVESASTSTSMTGSMYLHRYRAHQVAGPSTYYFGLVDILQKWTFSKQVERAYKVHMLCKNKRGVSAIGPRAYAMRFQRKMKQLLATSSRMPQSFSGLDDPLSPSQSMQHDI